MAVTHFIEVYRTTDDDVEQGLVLWIQCLAVSLKTSEALGIKTIAIFKIKRK